MVSFFSLKNIKYVILITFNLYIQDFLLPQWCVSKNVVHGWLKQGDFLAV